jgi:DNA-binding response OmpR family regulator
MRILSIDDDPCCRMAVSRCLSFSGEHSVETAEGGRDGVKKACASLPDLILLDLRMPDMDGFAVMETLSSDPSTMAIPVVILTGATLGPDQEKALKSKNNFLLLEQKPCDLNRLLKTAEALIARKKHPAARNLGAGPDNMKILIAEDDDNFRALITEVLEQAGHTPLAEANGRLAWERLLREGADLLVTDINMPEMDGFELLRTVRETSAFRELPVLLLTIRELAEDQVAGYESGADDYLTKPFDGDVLTARVHALARRTRKARE